MTDSTAPQDKAWRALARPTLWFFGGVLTFWFWRVLSLLALRKWGREIDAGVVLSFVWDVCLCAGVFGLARIASRSFRPLGLRLLSRTLIYSLIFAAFLARAADVAYAALTGGHWSSPGFLYLSAENLNLLHDGDGPLLVASMIAATLLSFIALHLDVRANKHAANKHADSPRRVLGFAAGLSLLCVLLPLCLGFSAIEEETARFVPEALFVHEWLLWRGAYDEDVPSDLPPETRRRFVTLGLMPSKPLYPDYPLSQSTADFTPLPAAAKPLNGRPNLVFTLVEQLNHEFVNAFSDELPGVMPELSTLAKRMTMVTNYQSTTTPTIHALMTSLCSLHSAKDTRALNLGQGSDSLMKTAFVCLPQILAERGYRTVFIQGGKKEFANKADFLLAHGFAEVHGRPELEQRFPGQDISRWGMHDDVLVDYTEEQIKRLEALQAKDGRPFFLMMLTLDTHSPGLAPPTCALPEALKKISTDSDSRTMLRSLHCSDASLGRLGHFIVDDPVRNKRTLWALTGDHPTSAMKFVRDIHQKHKRTYPGWSGRLPLMLYDPTHTLPKRVAVLSSHIDLAPTFLHLLGVQNAPSSMSGLSIFGRRAKLPLLIGRVGPTYVALFRPKETRSLTMGLLNQLCAERAPLIERDSMALSACELQTWVRWQDSLWKNKRLFPAPAH